MGLNIWQGASRNTQDPVMGVVIKWGGLASLASFLVETYDTSCVRHEGTPEGKFETVGGINCYVGTPSTAYPRDTVILFLTDVFGINLPNALTRPPFDSIITALKEQGVTRFGATGYCFGGRYVFNLAFEHTIHVSVANHPWLLQSPEDFEKYFATSHVALLINSYPIDEQFPTFYQVAADEVLATINSSQGTRENFFKDARMNSLSVEI
ncbi:hypothetical protein SERLA73DRAFT_79884 [Serpula lacrymans var. lacrymans S7.3]|uniref:Dienelactone hydrolase domain-containing protein n=1 Tax=Serpula lacrymans var. lacrymans (strain S7.3) TaxID=936435 RepID=F8QHX8_SERL3|nr:hypothetical protein SERLA73DRAFT_79884 [Serpula lacrymans var. lacrymans S7.3]